MTLFWFLSFYREREREGKEDEEEEQEEGEAGSSVVFERGKLKRRERT